MEKKSYELVNSLLSNLKPQFITSRSGQEYHKKYHMAECFSICDRISSEASLLTQETHRNDWSYAAHVVKDYLKEFSSLQLVLDFSQWLCVYESDREHQQEAIDLVIKHGVHFESKSKAYRRASGN